MTLQDLLVSLLDVSVEDRKRQEVKLFDHQKNEFVPLPELNVCVEGEPSWHLTIN